MSGLEFSVMRRSSRIASIWSVACSAEIPSGKEKDSPPYFQLAIYYSGVASLLVPTGENSANATLALKSFWAFDSNCL